MRPNEYGFVLLTGRDRDLFIWGKRGIEDQNFEDNGYREREYYSLARKWNNHE